MAADREKPELVVFGSVSVDRVRTPEFGGVVAPGGAGLYAALGAATRVRTGLVGIGGTAAALRAMRVPDRLDTSGLLALPGRELRFDIGYDDRWRATYLVDGTAAEQVLGIGSMPAGYASATAFHLCPTGCPVTQLQIAVGLRAGRAGIARRLTATTFRERIRTDPEAVHELWRLCDGLICNAEEACLLTGCGSPEAALDRLVEVQARRMGARWFTCVTDAWSGCHLVTGSGRRHVPAYPTRMLDPTGAGETFGGALAASLLRGDDLHAAACFAAAVASCTVEAFGPARLVAAPAAELERRRQHIFGSAQPVAS